jgi:hypothetical protein
VGGALRGANPASRKSGKKRVAGNSDLWNSRKMLALAAGSKVGYHHRSLTGRFGGGSFG